MASHVGFWRLARGAAAERLSRREAVLALGETPHLFLNAPLLAARLGIPECPGLDLLELFAFVHPARFLVPSPVGLAQTLDLPAPAGPEAELRFLCQVAETLLSTMASPQWSARAGAWDSARRLARRAWAWSPAIARVLAPPPAPEPSLFDALPRWEETAPRPAPRVVIHSAEAVSGTLAQLRGNRREPRPEQDALALALAHAFQPRESRDGPNLVVAEAGTGIGKTLAYLAPASLHARETGGPVWLSTYTRALQRQLKAEVEASLPPTIGGRPVVVRKGRENYLCLLNLEDALQGTFSGRAGLLAELVARWARFTSDGDMVGGDLPGWLPALFRNRVSVPALSDRRGECIRAACPHFRRCFIERSVRGSAEASLVIANHALTMAVATRGGADLPPRIVFDEGHHLFDAADSAFSLALTGAEAIELRRWFLGPEANGRRSGRRRGLAARLIDVASYDAAGKSAIEAVTAAARDLPADGWLDRLIAGEPQGPVEELLSAIRMQVLTRAGEDQRGFTLETEIVDLLPGLLEAASAASLAIDRLGRAVASLRAVLSLIVAERPEWLDSQGVARIEAAEAGLADRAVRLSAWGALLSRVGAAPDPDFVDWFALVRAGGQERDAGLYRHWLDPMKPLAEAVLGPAQGVAVTSATLGAATGGEEAMSAAAGAGHLATRPRLFRAPSPFDYARQARVFIASDVQRKDMASLAFAFAALVEAAGGGTLGLFTAIDRLRAVHARIADRLAEKGLPLFAQHVDPVDTGTLVDLFRADPRASILGTDTLRDGVDVPGDSLRLLVFEGVPWSRPTILEAARRAAGGGAAHEDAAVRRRLAQAFGRLIRSADDRGAFVLLGPQVPSRLLDALPGEVPVARMPLSAIAEAVSAFLGPACARPTRCLVEGEVAARKG